MFKRVTLINKKDGMSREDFIKYYEEKHLPLCMSMLPPPLMHRRNYPIPNDAVGATMSSARAKPTAPDVDCISEVIHKTRADAERYIAKMGEPEISKRIIADEANFIQPGGIKVFIVEVYERPGE